MRNDEENIIRDIMVIYVMSTMATVFIIKHMLKYYLLKYYISNGNEPDNDLTEIADIVEVPDDSDMDTSSEESASENEAVYPADVSVDSDIEVVGLREVLETVIECAPRREEDIRCCMYHYQRFIPVLNDIKKLHVVL